jgi:hypothetical protein
VLRVTALRRPPLDATYELLELQRKVLADGVRERTAAADKALRRSAEDSKGTRRPPARACPSLGAVCLVGLRWRLGCGACKAAVPILLAGSLSVVP